MKSADEPAPRLAESQRVEPAAGVHCWVTGDNQINLPKGLREHDLGWIVGHHERDFLIVCRNRRWVLDCRQFDTPELYRNSRGVWVPEWHPSVERYLRAALARHRAWRVTRSIRVEHRYSMIARLKWRLRRNGWEVEDLPGDGYGN